MREAMLGAAVGKKAVGKTFATYAMIKQYIQGNPLKGIAPRRVLILDVNNEFEEVKTISIKDVERFSQHPKVEVRRIVPINETTGERMTLNEIAEALFIILKTFRGGLLLIEDINKYVSDNLPNDLIGAICTQRHIDLDIIMHFQSIGRLTPKIWSNINWIRFHKNTDSVKRHKDKFEDKYEILSIVENMVNKEYQEGNKRYYAYINTDEMHMLPNYDRDKFKAAVEEYLDDHYASLIGPKLKERNDSGNLKYTPQTARQFHRNRIMLEYTPDGADYVSKSKADSSEPFAVPGITNKAAAKKRATEEKKIVPATS